MTKRDDMVTKLLAGWVSVPDLLAATGWLPHTLRAAICVAAKKHGYKVERQRIDGITSYCFAAKIVAEVAAE